MLNIPLIKALGHLAQTVQRGFIIGAVCVAAAAVVTGVAIFAGPMSNP